MNGATDRIMLDIDTKVPVVVSLYDAGFKVGIAWVGKDGMRRARGFEIPIDIINDIKETTGYGE